MQDFRKRRNLKDEILRTALRTLGAVALLALAFVAVRAAWDMYGKFTAASQARADADAQFAQVESQYNDVTAKVAALSTSRGVEGEVRQRYGLGLPGEQEIDIVRQASTTTPAGSGGEAWWQRLWHALFVW